MKMMMTCSVNYVAWANLSNGLFLEQISTDFCVSFRLWNICENGFVPCLIFIKFDIG